jgi:hypothetical protein
MKINPGCTRRTLHTNHGRHSDSKASFWLLLVLLLFAGFAPSRAHAQDTSPQLQVFGGYSYLRYDTQTLGFTAVSGLNGWNGSVAWNLTKEFGVKAELTGQYGAHLNFRDLALGPQFLYPRGNKLFFAHALIGRARTFVNLGSLAADTGNAVILGGGFDYQIRNRFSIRVIQADYVHTSLLQESQNNIRLSTGLVFHMGSIHRRRHAPPNTQTP